jgi:hypothetical protein
LEPNRWRQEVNANDAKRIMTSGGAGDRAASPLPIRPIARAAYQKLPSGALPARFARRRIGNLQG